MIEAAISKPLVSIIVPVYNVERYIKRCVDSLQGQTLHAMVLGFIHPRTGAYMEFEAPLPEYFSNLLLQFRKNV